MRRKQSRRRWGGQTRCRGGRNQTGSWQGKKRKGETQPTVSFLKKNDWRKAVRKSQLRQYIKTFLTLCKTPAICLGGGTVVGGIRPVKHSIKNHSVRHQQRQPQSFTRTPCAPHKQASPRLCLCSTAPEWGPDDRPSGGDTRWAMDIRTQQGDRQQ